MHLSMHNWMRSEPIETTIARLAKYGYKSIEISGEPTIYDSKHVRGLLDHYKLNCWGAVTLMIDRRNMQSSDEAKRAASVQYVKDVITFVHELDGQIVTLVPGTVRKAGHSGRRRATQSVRVVLDHSRRAGSRTLRCRGAKPRSYPGRFSHQH